MATRRPMHPLVAIGSSRDDKRRDGIFMAQFSWHRAMISQIFFGIFCQARTLFPTMYHIGYIGALLFFAYPIGSGGAK
ncbi:hypothetical protein CHN51_04020 [Sphingorhabdus sp. YGSMI21]|nr:hypothetical protein CHN51_04020 [Sphingorhabdus sp. YGSMI21]